MRSYEVMLSNGERHVEEADGFEPYKDGFSFYKELSAGETSHKSGLPREDIAWYGNVQMIRIMSPEEIKDEDNDYDFEKTLAELLELTEEKCQKAITKARKFVKKL